MNFVQRCATWLRTVGSVGRASRVKRDRRERRKQHGREFADLDRDTALQVIAAATASPSCAHRSPSLANATVACWRHLGPNARRAGAEHLPLLLNLGSGDDAHASLEHDEPLDIRTGTRVRWGSSLFRVAPGGWERPVSIIEDAWTRVRTLDPVLEQKLGFGVFDLVDVALRHGDEVLERLEEHWPTAEAGDDEDPWFHGSGFVSQAEVDAAGIAPTLAQTIGRCPDPKSAARAIRWASRAPDALRCEPSMSDGLFGPVLAVDDNGTPVAFPVGFLLDGIHDAVSVLTSIALEAPGQSERFLAAAKSRTLHLISGRGAPLAPDATIAADQIVAVQQVNEGLLLAVDIAVPIGGHQVAAAEARLSAFVPGARFGTERGTVEISERDEVIRLVVVHNTDSMTFLRGSDDLPVSWLTVEDLRWIMTQAERPDDLAMFLRSLQRKHAEHMFSFGPFDLWENWSANGGAFHRRGQPLTGLFFSPHSERAEWHWHADKAWVEASLLNVGLRQLAAWPVVVQEDDARVVQVIDRPARDAVHLIRSTDGRTVTAIRYDPRDDANVPLATMADAMCWKFRHLDGDTALIAEDHGVRIELRRGEVPLAIEREGTVIVITVGDELEEALAVSSAEVEEAIGAGIASNADRAAREKFVDAWTGTPPGIVVDQLSVPQFATGLVDLHGPHPSLISEADRAMAERLFADGAEPGVRRGTAARDLESRTIYPVVLRHLHDCFAAFDRDGLLGELLADLERSMASRWREEGDHARRAALAAATAGRGLAADDIVAKVAESRSDRTVLTRIVMLCIEEVLRDPPSGTANPSAFERDRMYAVGRHLFEAGMRSETIHQRLSETEIEITDGYEVVLHNAPGDLDFDKLQYTRAARSMPERPNSEEQPQPGPPISVSVALPKLAGIDAALRSECGFGLDSLLGVPEALTGWPVDDDAPVGAATVEAITSFCADALVLKIDPGELHAAARWLTLTPEGVASDLRGGAIEHWELNRRAHRLATRPLVPTSDGRVFVAPWTAGYTRTILAGNLLDGRLPWPDTTLPATVTTALKQYRQDRNTDLERETLTAFEALPDFIAIGNVKKPKVLGLRTLPREIDVVAVDERRGRLWVVEVKDRTVAWSPHQMRTAINEFNGVNGYVSKVVANVAILATHANTVAASLGAAARKDWDVRGAMVTRRVEPAAFSGEPPILYCTVEAIAATFDSDDLPDARYGQAG